MTAGAIRPCGRSDIATVVALQRLCFPSDQSGGVAWTSEALGAHLEAPDHIITLAVPSVAAAQGGHDPSPMPEGGFLVARWMVDEAEILLLGVAPAWRRQGLAREMTEDFLAHARRADVRRCHLEVARDNAAALALYRNLGFVQVGRRKGYYNYGLGLSNDALLLCKTL